MPDNPWTSDRFGNSETVAVHTKCPGCGKTSTLEVSAAGYKAWKSGELIQRALPELSADTREQLMTGYCTPCWDKLFAFDDAAETDREGPL